MHRPLLLACSIALAGSPLIAQATAVGLQPQHSLLLANENLIFYVPEPSDLFGTAFAVGDFDGDGIDDLATGIPLDDGLAGDPIPDMGAVVVRYGGREFVPSQAAPTFLSQRQAGSPSPAEEGDRHGRALAAGDFNGDGYDDLAIGAPEEDHGIDADCGIVLVHYGSPQGLAFAAAQLLNGRSAGAVAPDNDSYDFSNNDFGYALVAGNFDGDAYDDLAIGSPGSPFGWQYGQVYVLHGQPSGLLPYYGYSFGQDPYGPADSAESGDRFGFALAAGDFDASGHDDLVIGVPGEDGGAGAVMVMMGSQFQLIYDNHVFYRQSDLGATNQPNDLFGNALAAGDFDGDGHDDLAVGAPGQDVINLVNGLVRADAGAVTAIYGAPSSFDLARTQHWYQNTIDGLGSSETNDLFGWALAVGDFDDDGRADLAIGAPGEDVTGPDEGTVDVMMGAAAGLSNARRYAFVEGRDGLVGDATQYNKELGRALVAGDFDGNGSADLVLGVPYRDAGGVSDVGAAIFVPSRVSIFVDGFESGDVGAWSDAVGTGG